MAQPTFSDRLVNQAAATLSWLATPIGQLTIFFCCLVLLGGLVYQSVWQPLASQADVNTLPTVPTLNRPGLAALITDRQQLVSTTPPVPALNRVFPGTAAPTPLR